MLGNLKNETMYLERRAMEYEKDTHVNNLKHADLIIKNMASLLDQLSVWDVDHTKLKKLYEITEFLVSTTYNVEKQLQDALNGKI